MTLAVLAALFDAFARAALASVVASCIAEHFFAREVYPSPMTFDVLVSSVRFCLPDADACEIDAAARPYQRGEPGAYTYEPIEDPPEGSR